MAASTMNGASVLESVRGSFYCSTSGTVFEDVDALTQHYKSDFHRYNLKRKVAELPPVTREWFEARKSQLAVSSSTQSEQKLWIDPLTKKKFSSENTYLVFTQSKKYKDLVRKSGEPAPPPMIVTRKQQDGSAQPSASTASTATGPVFSDASSRVAGVFPAKKTAHPQAHISPAFKSVAASDKVHDGQAVRDGQESDEGSSAAESDGSDWETDDEDREDWQEWDVCMSFFDSHVSASLEANLDYMQYKFGFTLPDRQHLKDPEGLVRYLGAKLQYGKVPLYVRGDDNSVKNFRSLHAVQRHMIDTNQCKVVYEDNEEEYADFYSYDEEDDTGNGQLIESGGAVSGMTPAYELVVSDARGRPGKIVGSRELQRYYKQRHKPEEARQSVIVNTFLAKYRALALNAQPEPMTVEKAMATKVHQQIRKRQLRLSMQANILTDLPKNVPY